MNFLDEDYLIEKGEITRDLLLEHKLTINIIEEGAFLKHYCILPYEEGLKEYRVSIGKLHDLDYVKDMWCDIDNIEDYIKEFGENDEYLDKFKIDLNKIDKNVIIEESELAEFSIFYDIDCNVNTLSKKNTIIFENFCLGQAITYYQNNLNLFADKNTCNYYIISEYCAAYLDDDNDDNFKTFLETNYIEIDNYNIELVKKYAYRLYKDSKAIFDIGELLDINFKEFNKIIMDI